MSYHVFVAKTTALAAREGFTVRHHQAGDGRFFADFSDGTRMIGNGSTLRVEVRFRGNQHRAYATL